jgi:hypothetical protein
MDYFHSFTQSNNSSPFSSSFSFPLMYHPQTLYAFSQDLLESYTITITKNPQGFYPPIPQPSQPPPPSDPFKIFLEKPKIFYVFSDDGERSFNVNLISNPPGVHPVQIPRIPNLVVPSPSNSSEPQQPPSYLSQDQTSESSFHQFEKNEMTSGPILQVSFVRIKRMMSS